MANLSKVKRDRIIEYLEKLKKVHSDDESIIALNEIETTIKEKKFGLVFEEHEEEVDILLRDNIPVFVEDSNRRIKKSVDAPMNFLIEGDNLQALYLLAKTHKGKVDCIYIDPPYNTGAKDWKYNNDYVDSNDTYRHSKWLSMMKRRLEVAKTLLSSNGSLICAIDENELNTLGLLLQEMFQGYNIDCIAVVHNPGGIQGANFSYCHEYAYFIYPQKSYYISKEIRNDGDDLAPFRDWGKENSKRLGSPNCFYPIYVNPTTNEIIGTGSVPDSSFHPESANEMHDGVLWVWPIDVKGVERRWRFAYDTVSSIISELVPVTIKGIVNIQRAKKMFTRKTVWNNPLFAANNSGTQLLAKFIGNRFPFPKSLYLVRECLRAVEQKKDAVILDFFAGSGTTFHAVNLMNAVDGGTRKCIMVTNNEVSYEESKRLTKLGFKKGDPEWEQYGIAQYVNWPRAVTSINGKDLNGNPIPGIYAETDINMSTGFCSNIKYLKCDWIERKPEEYLLSNALCMHIKEMLEIQNFIEIDNRKYVLLFNKKDFDKYVNNNSEITRIWYNQNIIFSVEESKVLKQLKATPIPKDFFGQELKEAGE